MSEIKISELTKDGLQTRVALDERTVTEYAEAMRDGAQFPPVKVFTSGGRCWLADGFHRVEAATRAGRSSIEADYTTGSFIDALRWALGCNAKHGKRVTNEDKQNAMQMAWEHRQELFGGDPSAPLLAQTCGVHKNTAAAFVADHMTVQPPAVTAPVRLRMSANVGNEVAQNVLPAAAPMRPVRTVVGTDGKQYPVRPQRPVSSIPRDRYGTAIPMDIASVFSDDYLDPILSHISAARCAIEKARDEKILQLGALRQEALVQLNNAYNFVKAAKPWCVCPVCKGYGGADDKSFTYADNHRSICGCKSCHGRGWQTAEEYDRNPQEFKA